MPGILVVYSMVMLAQHTLLHVEDRYGFPIIPLCLIMLAAYGERSLHIYRTSGYQKILLLSLFCIVAWAIFMAQIINWDNTALAILLDNSKFY
jgi:hypothetical protein